ncbi:glycosyltransferase [Gramella jeungdoensis]|uniref:Glycosyltransferase n=1 Tax=Gramella jeungdoensis TaxID=708091 RepID=A0ABT0Z0H4_9FLAO|nr:glycosyltransferase [Gramella jeungdoensis]MCM8569227.1 glycosyltransferase [Gramella jeungdoensis]
MKILQLIDTLHPGGAERMAVNYANALYDKGHDSHLICTREEGSFKALLNPGVSYLLLNKKSVFDIQSLLKLRKYISLNNIEVVHAHGSSWFYAILCKIIRKDFKVIWHDHYGNSEYLEKRPTQYLKCFSQFFDGIISVNKRLEKWAMDNLRCENITFINNFIYPNEREKNKIHIDNEAFNIVCLANLRIQKDHLTLMKACDIISKKHSIVLHIIGKDFRDEYSKMIKREFKKRSYLVYHGEVKDSFSFLENMNLGVLSSRSEGLPLTLLEYGLAGLSVVCTDVGECRRIVGNNGILIPPGDVRAMREAILKFIKDPSLYCIETKYLKEKIRNHYSYEAVLPIYERFCEKLC